MSALESMQDVVQRAQADIGRQGQIQEQQAAAQAVGSGAFGGSRAAVLQGEIGRNVLEQQARTAAQLRESGYQQAQQLAGQRSALFSGLGQLGQQLQTQDINTLLGLGGMTQQQAQAQLDVDRRNLLAQQAQQLAFTPAAAASGFAATPSAYGFGAALPTATAQQYQCVLGWCVSLSVDE